jgi:IclR family transcriptional regulator, blcABC operon repressor
LPNPVHLAEPLPPLSLTVNSPLPSTVAPRPPLVPAVARALAVMDLLAREPGPMHMAGVAAALDLPKSSVHGLCNTLLSFGWLRRTDNGALQIGPGVMSLAGAFVARTSVAQEFNALWQERGAAPEETILLSVLSGTDVVYVAARSGTRPLGLAFNVGMHLPAHLAATGKAMLAFHDPVQVRARFGTAALAPMTGKGPRRLSELMKELALTRERGYSIDDEGVREGVVCFGAPVFDASAGPVAGVGVCLNKAMLTDGVAQRHQHAVMQAARALSQRLGAQVPRVGEPA